MTNRGRAAMNLGRGCGPPADVTITTPAGREHSAVADLLASGEVRGMFICLPTDANRAEPGETDTVPIAWRAPAERGTYTAVSTVYRGDTVVGRSAPVRFTVR